MSSKTLIKNRVAATGNSQDQVGKEFLDANKAAIRAQDEGIPMKSNRGVRKSSK